MGSGSWDHSSFANYTTRTKGVSLDAFTSSTSYRAQDIYKASSLSKRLNPFKVTRECRDSEEHPNTLPVILALDVTGSMGGSAVKVAQKLNEIMTTLYQDESIPDVEFCIMGIGDFAYDRYPVQMSQFESDIRIAEQLDELYFERGGGGNTYESYTAAWYMGVNHCDLDCWKRGQKGIIITLGDECPNPYIPTEGYHCSFARVIGDRPQADIETSELIKEAKEKFNLYHISVDDDDSCYEWHNSRYNADEKWAELLGKDNYRVSTLDNLAQNIITIISENVNGTAPSIPVTGEEVVW